MTYTNPTGRTEPKHTEHARFLISQTRARSPVTTAALTGNILTVKIMVSANSSNLSSPFFPLFEYLGQERPTVIDISPLTRSDPRLLGDRTL